MPRGVKARTWVKLDCNGILRGSINYQLTLEEQAVWIKLFAYSAVCGGEPGIISDNDGKPMPDWYIAQELHCSPELLKVTVDKCIKEGRISQNGAGILEITNFKVYQFTEYDRQKPYRQMKKAELEGKPVSKKCPACNYKGKTAATNCPKCGEELGKDYKGGSLGHRVKD